MLQIIEKGVLILELVKMSSKSNIKHSDTSEY